MDDALPPTSYKFFIESKEDDGEHSDEKRLTFLVVERDRDENTRTMVVLPDYIGCVTLSFNPRPSQKWDDTVVVDSIKHDTKCAAEGLPRKYGTRAMILGTFNVLKELAKDRYPHLREFHLDDEASYPCPPFSVGNGKRIKTFATDLLLAGKTYYERHLNVKPCSVAVLNIVNNVKKRVTEPIDMTFDSFWTHLVGPVPHDTERTSEQLNWLVNRKDALRRSYEKSTTAHDNWREFFQTVHQKYGCVFFSCCWWRLCIMFNMTRLVGASWKVSFKRLPLQSFTIIQDENKSGGGRRPNHVSRKIDRRVQKEMQEVLDRKIKGRFYK